MGKWMRTGGQGLDWWGGASRGWTSTHTPPPDLSIPVIPLKLLTPHPLRDFSPHYFPHAYYYLLLLTTHHYKCGGMGTPTTRKPPP